MAKLTPLEAVLSELGMRIKELIEMQQNLKEEIFATQEDYSTEKVLLHQRIDEINVQIHNTIKEAVAQIRVPEDGISFDEEIATRLITAQINELLTQKDKDLSTIRETFSKFIQSEMIRLRPRDGIDGKDGRNGTDGQDATDSQIEEKVTEWIESNKDELKGERGFKGEATKGEEGRGLKDTYLDKMDSNYVIFEYTDGTKKRIRLPSTSKTVFTGGGGHTPDNFSYDLVDKIVHIPHNQQMIVMGEITIESELHIDGRLILED